MDEGYIRNNLKAIQEGKEINVAVRDTRFVFWRKVKAILSKEPLPGGERLGLRTGMGILLPDEWHIKIVEELPQDTPLSCVQAEV
jgi:hypothetical protein